MGLFGKKTATCTLCKKETTHKHRPKREWNMEYPLCTDCYMKSMEQYYSGSLRQKCVNCGTEEKLTDLWEPRWQWNMEGLLCKKCFDSKEVDYNQKKDFCTKCGAKLSFIRYNPKNNWNIEGQLCRDCWDEQKEKHR